MLEKCKWFNNYQAPCCLMIDDLAPVAISRDGRIGANNDWGYLMDKPGSLYKYLDQWLFQKYPEIRGTIFLPLESHNYVSPDMGYKIIKRDIDDSYINFLDNLQDRFEFAFHGIKHCGDEELKGKFIHEYTNADIEYIEYSVSKVESFKARNGISFLGGKFPGYSYNELSLSLIKKIGFKWWALDAYMINRRNCDNNIKYSQDKSYICIPTNASGDLFRKSPSLSILRNVKRKLKNTFYLKPEKYIQYLYKTGLPITIQEHYQNQGTDGKRQTPNLYDDIKYLDDLFGYLRRLDIWFANCSDIAHYFDSYSNTRIKVKENKIIIEYKGLWDKPYISIRCDKPAIINLADNQQISGCKKGNYWIFNELHAGEYHLL